MTICILGNNLTALTLAKALVNQKIDVDVLFNKKNYKISDSRTIGITKSNVNFFNNNIINIEKIIWKIKNIEIFSENLKKESLINFKANNDHLFSIVKNNKLYQLLEKDLLKSKIFRSKFSNEKDLSFINKYELIINCDSSNFIQIDILVKRYLKNIIATPIRLLLNTMKF